MRRLRLALIALLAVFLVYSGGSWFIASQATVAKRLSVEQTPASVGLQYQNVDFSSRGDGVNLKGWYIKADKPDGVLIIVHGIDSNKADPDVGYLQMAKRLHDKGISVFQFDLRGHGQSGNGKLSAGQFEQRDLLGALDWVLQSGVSPQRVGVLGVSMGGAISLLAASHEPRIQAVVADSSFADLSDLLAKEVAKRLSIPVWLAGSFDPGVTVAADIFYGIDLKGISPEKAIAQLRYPVLLIHSKVDERIAYSHSLRLKAASPNPDTVLWTVDKAAHAKSFLTYPDEYIDRVTAYLESRWK